MIRTAAVTDLKTGVLFFTKEAAQKLYDGEGGIFRGEYLQTFPRMSSGGKQEYCIGLGEKALTKRDIMEAAACAAACMREHKINRFYVNTTGIASFLTEENLPYFVQGLYLGGYEQPRFGKENRQQTEVTLLTDAKGYIAGLSPEKAGICVEHGMHMAEGVLFARDMVNYPGNLLRPSDFAEAILKQMEGLDVETEVIDRDRLQEMEMGGLLTVGGGSAFPPCMVVLRYQGAKETDSEVLGLVGKGVTCDTGGYCLKPPGSMAGIRGDMAGGAAVAGCIFALAKNRAEVNVTGIIPVCENRISPDSYLPGDVITMYDKTRVEICNTDAEGRLILGDAVSYAVDSEGVDQVVDIATLTGAVVNLFGFSVGGVLSDDEELYARFGRSGAVSGEQYARIPYYKEHEDMLESTMADLKNLGPDYCGTITAGLFIRHFAKGKPWLHIDIAGTAWVDTPIWKFQSKGATGAGVTTLYEMAAGIRPFAEDEF